VLTRLHTQESPPGQLFDGGIVFREERQGGAAARGSTACTRRRDAARSHAWARGGAPLVARNLVEELEQAQDEILQAHTTCHAPRQRHLRLHHAAPCPSAVYGRGRTAFLPFFDCPTRTSTSASSLTRNAPMHSCASRPSRSALPHATKERRSVPAGARRSVTREATAVLWVGLQHAPATGPAQAAWRNPHPVPAPFAVFSGVFHKQGTFPFVRRVGREGRHLRCDECDQQ